MNILSPYKKIFKYFLKGYASILNLYPRTNDYKGLKKDVNNVASDFWKIIEYKEKK